MKTRVIQNDPDEPSKRDHLPGAAAEPRRPTNLAGRMGRWSAQHRKIAIFGWFAFVIVAFALGIVSGTTQIDDETSGVGESGRVDRILDAGFKQPAGESVLVQSETLTVKDPVLQRRSKTSSPGSRSSTRSRTSARRSTPKTAARSRAAVAPRSSNSRFVVTPTMQPRRSTRLSPLSATPKRRTRSCSSARSA
jgi:hypothetical protein